MINDITIIDEKLTRYKTYINNWDSYGAEAPKLSAIDLARKISVIAINNGMVIANISPSSMGGMGICFVNKDKYAGIEILNDGDIELTLRDKKCLKDESTELIDTDKYEEIHTLDKTDIELILTQINSFLLK